MRQAWEEGGGVAHTHERKRGPHRARAAGSGRRQTRSQMLCHPRAPRARQVKQNAKMYHHVAMQNERGGIQCMLGGREGKGPSADASLRLFITCARDGHRKRYTRSSLIMCESRGAGGGPACVVCRTAPEARRSGVVRNDKA